MSESREYTLVSLSPNSCGMGDCLIMLEQAKGIKNAIFVLPSKAAGLAPLFHHLAPVLVMDEGVGKVGSLALTCAEIAEGAKLAQGLKHPIIIKRNTSVSGAACRQTDPKRWDVLSVRLKASGWTPIQTGFTSDQLIEGAVHIADLPLRTLAALYHAVGIYVGVDTGDRWLMQAVGGQTYVAGPADSVHYPHRLWVQNQSPSFHFCQFDQFDKLFDMLPKIT